VSDLSRLLGDVYGASTPPAEDVDAADPTTPTAAVPAAADDPPAPPVEDVDAGDSPAAPGWADEAVLDEAFAEWVPGPPSDAVAEERDILADVEPAEAVAEPIDIDAWLGPEADDATIDADAGPEGHGDELAATQRFEPFVPSPAPEPLAQGEAGWTRTSDDLLPRGRRGRRLSLSLRR
jgi:hypothetical protein